MPMITIASRDFSQDISAAKSATNEGPVLITEHGRPAYVLLAYNAYRTLAGLERSLLDIVAQDEDDAIEFDPPRIGGEAPPLVHT